MCRRLRLSPYTHLQSHAAPCIANSLRPGVLSGIVLSRGFGVEAVDNGGGGLDLGGLDEQLEEEQHLSVPGHSSAWGA